MKKCLIDQWLWLICEILWKKAEGDVKQEIRSKPLIYRDQRRGARAITHNVNGKSGFGGENHGFRAMKGWGGNFSFLNAICVPAQHVAFQNSLYHATLRKLTFALEVT